ncbi:MAG: thiamine biosynthesis protein ThiS [Thermoprotei archaeon]|nr:MAG: thiamine biosynthesis protein ThiS [Thermoprotei archaeon]
MSRIVEVSVSLWSGEEKKLKVKRGVRVEDILKMLGLNREAVLCLLNNELVVESERILEDCKLKILSVVSGG